MKNLSVKLLLALLLFSIILVTVMSLMTRYILINDVDEEQAAIREDIENQIVTDLETMDRAHMIFQQIESEAMETGLRDLREYYKQDPDVLSWDLDSIKERHNMDFYILNDDGKVIVTTHEPSKNLDFNDCCPDFVELIQERIQTDEFYYDGLEISVAANDARMYGYLPTADHEYLLEFGILFEDTEVAKEFNYEHAVDTLLTNYQDLVELRLLTYNGFILNSEPDLLSYEDLAPKLQEAFLEASETHGHTEITEELDGGVRITHHFIPYKSDAASGNITERIIYAQYSNKTEQDLMERNTIQFIIMLFVGIVTAALLLLFILRILNNTIRLATYDTLTGAYNRASYLQYIDGLIHDRKQYPLGLMLIDLDNFKAVNDTYGHAAGDTVLIEVTDILKKVTGKNGYVARFGDDEFAIVYEKATPELLRAYGEALLTEMRNHRATSDAAYWSVLSMSLGGAIQQEPHEQESELFERADQALYESKDKGKDTYTYSKTN